MRAANEVLLSHYQGNDTGKPLLSQQPFSEALSCLVNQGLANRVTHTLP